MGVGGGGELPDEPGPLAHLLLLLLPAAAGEQAAHLPSLRHQARGSARCPGSEGPTRGHRDTGYCIHTIHSTGYRILYPACIGYSSPGHTSDQLDTQPAPVLPPPHTGRLWSSRGGNHWKTKFQSSRKSMFRAKKYLFVQFQETRSRYGQN